MKKIKEKPVSKTKEERRMKVQMKVSSSGRMLELLIKSKDTISYDDIRVAIDEIELEQMKQEDIELN